MNVDRRHDPAELNCYVVVATCSRLVLETLKIKIDAYDTQTSEIGAENPYQKVDTINRHEDMFIRFDTTHERIRRTDRQTDRHRMTA